MSLNASLKCGITGWLVVNKLTDRQFYLAPVLFIFSLLFLSGCYNDEDLWNKISGLEERIKTLETWQAAASSNIDALQKLMDENDYITDVTPVILGNDTIGYTIRFKNQQPATIYHGEKGETGNTPAIGIKQSEEGDWYWTLDGEPITDSDGNMIHANAQTITPQLKLGSQLPSGTLSPIDETAVYLSVDGGKQWTKISGERGEQGEQGPSGSQGPSGPQGPAGSGGDGDSFFKDVKVYDDYVEFVLADGTKFSMPVSVQNYIDINDIDWDKSNVWKVMDGEKQVAEICKEGFCLRGVTGYEQSITYQLIVAYPIGEDGKTNLSAGYLVKYLGGTGDKSVAGGSVAWKARGTHDFYKEGHLESFIPGTEGKEEFLILMVTSSNKIKKCSSGINKYKLEPHIVADANGNFYPIVKIGAAYWMRENLRATKYNDGSELRYRRDATDDEKNATTYFVEDGTHYEVLAMYDYYKNDENFDVATQSDEVKRLYGLHYNFSAMAGDSDPWTIKTSGTSMILSQEGTVEVNKSLCPEGWHIPIYNTSNTYGNKNSDLEYIDYMFPWQWGHMMTANYVDDATSRNWESAQWWKSKDGLSPDNLTGLSLNAVPVLEQTNESFINCMTNPVMKDGQLQGPHFFWSAYIYRGIPIAPNLGADFDMYTDISYGSTKVGRGACSYPIRCVRN